MNLKYILIYPLIIAAFSAQTGCATATDSLQNSSVEKISVIDQKLIDFENFRLLKMSPDGKWVAGFDSKESVLIIYDLSVEKSVWQSPQRKGDIDRRNVHWSPDSRYLVFTENWAEYLYDSDIWLLDTQTWMLKDLTDDHYEGAGIISSDIIIDTSPGWTNNSLSIIFARSVGKSGTEFYKIPASGGKPALIFEPVDFYMSVWQSPWIDSEDKKIYYTLSLFDRNKSENGIWSYDLIRKQKLQHIGTDREKGVPHLTDFSADSGKGIVVFLNALMQYPEIYNSDLFYIWDSVKNSFLPVRLNSIPVNLQSCKQEYRIINTVLSPDGRKILSVAKTPDGFFYAVIKDLSNEKEKIILKSDENYFGVVNQTINSGLYWAGNNTILISADIFGNSAIIIKISMNN